MYNLDKAYNKKFFTQRASLAWRVPIIVSAVMRVLDPRSVIDVGCGNGDLVSGFHDTIGAPVFGIEGSTHALEVVEPWLTNYLFIRDLRAPLDSFLPKQADLAICFEVAEHIEEEYADTFVDNLCSLSDHILMSAAGPGQGGRHHVNCQPWSYWFHKFTARGYRHNPDIVAELRQYWDKWRSKKGIKAYHQNLSYWEKIKP